jgi:two-component system, chemotaxis family, protein-glutamate methylesterase/glutaminase
LLDDASSSRGFVVDPGSPVGDRSAACVIPPTQAAHSRSAGAPRHGVTSSVSMRWRKAALDMKRAATAKDFPVVCVGGSAGGLDAYIRLLSHLPADMGVAIVIVNHLRTVDTLLHEILPRHTKMPVELITEGLDLKPNHVFIIPPQRDLHVLDGEFRLKSISKPRGWPDVITVFLRSLTANWDGKIIAVIVSGFDGDGADALRGIKETGGITIAQKLDTAAHPDMPASAVASGYIDFILAPEDIAREIVRIAAAVA